MKEGEREKEFKRTHLDSHTTTIAITIVWFKHHFFDPMMFDCVRLNQSFPLLQQSLCFLFKVPWYGKLQNIWGKLQVKECLVEVDIFPRERKPITYIWIRSVPVHQSMFELHYSCHDYLECPLYFYSFLRMHHAVVAVLQLPEDLDVLYV